MSTPLVGNSFSTGTPSSPHQATQGWRKLVRRSTPLTTSPQPSRCDQILQWSARKPRSSKAWPTSFEHADSGSSGPSQEQAQLEGSKIYAKQFMNAAGIPTARAERIGDSRAAEEALAQFSLPVVIKADGLAGGKGVVIANTKQQALAAIQALGPKLLIEEFLVGEETQLYCSLRRPHSFAF